MERRSDYIQSVAKLFRKFPIIDFGDIILRELQLRDAASFLEFYQDTKSSRFASDENNPQNLEEATNSLKMYSKEFYDKQSIYWIIHHKLENRAIGNIHFNYWNLYSHRCDISYLLLSPYWNQKIMSRVLAHIINFAFHYMHIQRIEAKTMQGNVISQKLLIKNGFKHEGVLRQYRLIRGKYEDIYQFSLIRDDYNEPSFVTIT